MLQNQYAPSSCCNHVGLRIRRIRHGREDGDGAAACDGGGTDIMSDCDLAMGKPGNGLNSNARCGHAARSSDHRLVVMSVRDREREVPVRDVVGCARHCDGELWWEEVFSGVAEASSS